MTICAVYNCNSCNSKQLKRNQTEVRSDIKFFSFPKDAKFASIWVNKCQRKDQINIKNARLCSKHFAADQYLRNLRHELLNYSPLRGKKLKPDAIPTLHLPLSAHDEADKSSQSVLDSKAKKFKQECRDTVKALGDTVKALLDTVASPTDAIIAENNLQLNKNESISATITISLDKGCNTEPIVCTEKDHIESIERSARLEQELKRLQGKYDKLEQENNNLSKIFSPTQKKKLQNDGARIQWTEDDLSKSNSIYKSGPKAYEVLLNQGYPLPAVITIRKWVAKMNKTITE